MAVQDCENLSFSGRVKRWLFRIAKTCLPRETKLIRYVRII